MTELAAVVLMRAAAMRAAVVLGIALLQDATALQLPSPPRSLARPTRRTLLLTLPALAAPGAALAAATGGGFTDSQFQTQGGGPPKIGELAKLTKGEPSPDELKRLAYGYKRLQYLLANWEKETTVCIPGHTQCAHCFHCRLT